MSDTPPPAAPVVPKASNASALVVSLIVLVFFGAMIAIAGAGFDDGLQRACVHQLVCFHVGNGRCVLAAVDFTQSGDAEIMRCAPLPSCPRTP